MIHIEALDGADILLNPDLVQAVRIKGAADENHAVTVWCRDGVVLEFLVNDEGYDQVLKLEAS